MMPPIIKTYHRYQHIPGHSTDILVRSISGLDYREHLQGLHDASHGLMQASGLKRTEVESWRLSEEEHYEAARERDYHRFECKSSTESQLNVV